MDYNRKHERDGRGTYFPDITRTYIVIDKHAGLKSFLRFAFWIIVILGVGYLLD